jgi:probable rRNA maturation factor
MTKLTAQKLVNAEIYVENLYEGNLANENLAIVEFIPWDDWLQVWLESLSLNSNLVQNCEIGLRLTGDRQIQELNQQYRSLDQPTDVLAFAATESAITLPTDFTEPLYLGDIIISLDTAVQQATEQKHSLMLELAWLASHGLLHLLGWDHPDDLSLEQMLQRQSELIQMLTLEKNC